MNFEELTKLWNIYIPQNNSLFPFPENTSPELINIETKEITDYLVELFSYLTKKAKIRDNWEYKFETTHYDTSITAISKKQKHEYTFGIFDGDLYIESYILEPKNIKLMTSEFWLVLSKLDLIKSFSFQEDSVLSDSITFDKNTGKASVYRLVRNYVLLKEHQPNDVTNLGRYHASWSLTESLNEIQNDVIGTFKGIHKLNYLSYRREYQKHQKKA